MKLTDHDRETLAKALADLPWKNRDRNSVSVDELSYRHLQDLARRVLAEPDAEKDGRETIQEILVAFSAVIPAKAEDPSTNRRIHVATEILEAVAEFQRGASDRWASPHDVPQAVANKLSDTLSRLIR